MRRPDRITWSQATLSGLLFAIAMCVWTWFRHDAGFDELAIRFPVYFLIFSGGLYFLYNLAAQRKP